MAYVPPSGNAVSFSFDKRPVSSPPASYIPFSAEDQDPIFFDLTGKYFPPSSPLWFDLVYDQPLYVLTFQTHRAAVSDQPYPQISPQWKTIEFLPSRAVPKATGQVVKYFPEFSAASHASPNRKAGRFIFGFNLDKAIIPPAGDNIIFDCAVEIGEEYTDFFAAPDRITPRSFATLLTYIQLLLQPSRIAPTSSALLQQLIPWHPSDIRIAPQITGDIRRIIPLVVEPNRAGTLDNLVVVYTNPVLTRPGSSHPSATTSAEAEQLPEWRKPYRQQGGVTVPWQPAEATSVCFDFQADDGSVKDGKRKLPWQESQRRDAKRLIAAKDHLPLDRKPTAATWAQFEVYLDLNVLLAATDGLPSDLFKLIQFTDLDLFFDVQTALAALDGERTDIKLSGFCDRNFPLTHDHSVEIQADDGVFFDRLDYDVVWGSAHYPRPCQWYPILPETGDQVNFDFTEEDKQLLGNPTMIRRARSGGVPFHEECR